ncbi:hypothetical protein, partial [Thiolapillus sp.]|uniref:hypothetical protein n=1 Tax=Thiolapillus sp. TaxID=2017437 RepID=UPI003AF98174
VGYGLIQLLGYLDDQTVRQLCCHSPWRKDIPTTAGQIRKGLLLIFHHVPVRQWWNRKCRKQACLRPRDRFWDIPVPKIDSAFDNPLVPQPSWSPSTTQQLRKLVAAPYLAPNDWTPRSEAYFVFPLAQGTPGKQCGLAATGVYQPSLRSPWLAAVEP